MDELTRENIEKELQKDLEELEGKSNNQGVTMKKKSTKKKTAKTKSESTTKDVKAEKKADITTPKDTESETKKTDNSEEESLSPEEESRSRRVFYGGIAVIVILFVALLVGGKYLSPRTEPSGAATLTYNGYSFTKDATHWYFDWQKDQMVYTIPLRFNPEEAKEVPVKGILDPRFNKLSPVYVAFDPVSQESNFTYLSLGAGELSFNLAQALNKKVEPACAVDDGTPACNQTIVNCQNSDGKAVIFLKTEEPTGIFIKDTCIVLQGKDMELLRSIDRLLYEWYGVID